MITEWVMSPGDFKLRLRDDTPQWVLDLFDAWEHIVITDQWVDPDRFTDTQLKTMARWAGVLLELPRQGGPRDIGGLGLALHLGDPDGVGPIYETEITNSAETFPNWIRDLLPSAITEGTLHSASGTLTAAVQWVTPRQAIDWVCGQFSPPAGSEDVEWRVNPDGTLDAGPVSDLYITDPAGESEPCLLVSRDPGSQPQALAVPAVSLEGQDEAYRQIIKQWVHGEGEGETLVTGSASAATGLKDYHGNYLVRTAVAADSQASEANVAQRAGYLLRQQNHTFQRWEADLADFWVQGQLQLGDWILVYDQTAGFTDTDNEIDYRGERIWPDVVRVVGWTWAVTEGMGVYLRQKAGTWVDLTEYMLWEQPSTRLQLGDRPVESLGVDLAGEYRKKKYTADTATPNAPTGLSVAADTYIDVRGKEKASLIPSWTNPTENTDGSTLTDLDQIRIRFRRNGTSEKWEFRDFDSDGSGAVAVRRVDPDTVYEVQAQARRKNRRFSAYTASATVNTSHDTTAPGKPPTPTLDITSPVRITVSVDLTTYGPNNLDVISFPIWGNTVNNSATAVRRGRILVTHKELAAEETVTARLAVPSGELESDYYIWIKARDDGGNWSVFSDVASAVPVKVNTAHIGDQQVTGPKLGDGSVVALLTLSSTGKIRTAASGQRVELVATDGLDMLKLFSGLSGETAGRIYADVSLHGWSPPGTEIPRLVLQSPVDGTFPDAAYLHLWASSGTPYLTTNCDFYPFGTLSLGANIGTGDAKIWADVQSTKFTGYGIYDEWDTLRWDLSGDINPAGNIYTYTPTFTAATTNPGLGDGADAIATGWYRQIGKNVVGEVFIRFDDGATPASAGSGTYRIGIPVASIAYGYSVVLGDGYCRQDSTGYRWHLKAFYQATTYLNLCWDAQVGAGTVTHAVPFTWDDGDLLSVRFAYTAA